MKSVKELMKYILFKCFWNIGEEFVQNETGASCEFNRSANKEQPK